MPSTTCHALISLIITIVCGAYWSTIAIAEEPQFKPGDRVVVVSENAELKLGTQLVAKLSKDQQLSVIRVKGQFVGCILEVDGQKKTGWIPVGSVAKSQYQADASGKPTRKGVTDPAQPTPTGAMTSPVRPRPNKSGLWTIGAARASTQYGGKDIARSYVERDIGAQGFTLKPPSGSKLVVVACALSAVVPDPDAVVKLKNYRDELGPTKVVNPNAPQIPFSIGNKDQDLDQTDIAKLNGSYRMFEMGQMQLVTATRARYQPLWCLGPHGSYQVVGDTGGLVNAENGSQAPWHKTFATNRSYSGLLEVGQSVPILLLYVLPDTQRIDGLELQMESQPPVLVTSEKNIEERK